MSNPAPLVTFAILCYNQEQFVRDAVQGAFDQRYSPLEILISDDCSRDTTFAIVEQMVSSYKGPHRVVCTRNESNLGVAEHINKINRLASGKLIVGAAGDDISHPERTSRLVEAFLKGQDRVHYLYSTARSMSLLGVIGEIVSSPGAGSADSELRAALSPYPLAIGATQAWSKKLTVAFPPLHPTVWAEDQILGFRGMLLGPVCCIDEPLVNYRVGSGISTKKKVFSLNRYFKGRWSNIRIFRQRGTDARHVGHHATALVLAAKVTGLVVMVPFHPLVSMLRKLIKF